MEERNLISLNSSHGDDNQEETLEHKYFNNIPADPSEEINCQNFENSTNSTPVTDPLTWETPEEMALRIPIVLETILKYLKLEDLKTFRLINSTWDVIASNWISQRNFLYSSLHFQYNGKKKKYFLCSFTLKDHLTPHDPLKDLGDLLNDLQNSINFPCSSFTFIGGTMKEVEINEFFDLHGDKIKSLQFKAPFENVSDPQEIISMNRETFYSILTQKLPNLESLQMDYFPQLYDPLNLIDLPNLKKLTCLNSNYDSTVFAIVGKAPKLMEVYNFKTNYIQEFPKNCINTIKSFEFNFDLTRHILQNDVNEAIEKLIQFAKLKPQLKHLIIPFNKELTSELNGEIKIKLAYVLNSLLESSKETLEILEVDTFNCFQSIYIPQLNNLKFLTLLSNIKEDKPDEFMAIFPEGINLQNIFPNLISVKCDFVCDGETVKKYFPKNSVHGNWPRVQILEIILPTSFDKMAELMPNIKKIVINPLESIQYEISYLHMVYPNLNEIHLKCAREIWLGDREFTGISEKYCKLLDGSSPQIVKDFYVKYKELTSILDFKELKKLKISIANYDPGHEIKMPSQITGQILQQNPKLMAIFAYNQNNSGASRVTAALEKIGPYVKLVHGNFHQESQMYEVVQAMNHRSDFVDCI